MVPPLHLNTDQGEKVTRYDARPACSRPIGDVSRYYERTKEFYLFTFVPIQFSKLIAVGRIRPGLVAHAATFLPLHGAKLTNKTVLCVSGCSRFTVAPFLGPVKKVGRFARRPNTDDPLPNLQPT